MAFLNRFVTKLVRHNLVDYD